MPEKKTKADKRYRIDGKTFIWTTEDGAEVTIPMRVKLKVIRAIADQDLNNVDTMFNMLNQIAPGQEDAMDEMDIITDFQPMFKTWQAEYNALTGATPGESSPSTTS